MLHVVFCSPFSILHSSFRGSSPVTFGPVTEQPRASFLRSPENSLPYPARFPPDSTPKREEDLPLYTDTCANEGQARGDSNTQMRYGGRNASRSQTTLIGVKRPSDDNKPEIAKTTRKDARGSLSHMASSVAHVSCSKLPEFPIHRSIFSLDGPAASRLPIQTDKGVPWSFGPSRANRSFSKQLQGASSPSNLHKSPNHLAPVG